MDLRINHSELDIGFFEGSRGVGKSGAVRQEMQIYCDYQGNEIGSIMFYAYEGWPLNRIDPSAYKSNEIVSQLLYIKEVRVLDQYQNLGIGQLLYKKFGEIYYSKFQGWPVGRNFANPVAEYAYRKAVALGYINEMTLDEQYIKREYNTLEQKEKAKTLREKLPDQVKGPAVWSSIKKEAELNVIDARALNCDYTEKEINVNGAQKAIYYRITLNLHDGTEVGNMIFTAYENVSAGMLGLSKDWNEFIEKIIYIDRIYVVSAFRNNGIAIEIYKKFGEIYSEQFQNWPITRDFVNPVAEYTYRKAVSMGLIPEETMTEQYIKRDYNEQDKEKAKDLRKKLPKQFRGPQVWAKKQ